MALSREQFAKQLAESGLVSTDDLRSFLSRLPDGERPKDGEQLASILVRRNKLTRYQAQQVYAGKGQGLVLGNYVILDKLGEGGMGLVLKAEHQRMERIVALKVLSPSVVKTPAALRRFQREVKAAAKLTHPSIVVAYDADEAGGTHFLVMEFVEGSDLASLVKKQGPLAVDQALACIQQVAKGLEYAHQQEVVHRDIKPANLLLRNDGTVKILDMGLARLDTAGAQQDELTGAGQIMGTADYMAPEQALNIKSVDGRADIYSLGVTLWFLLTGRPMYGGETALAKMMAHQNQPIPSLREASGGPQPSSHVSRQLDEVFQRMVAKKPADRYQTMTEVLAAVQQCQVVEPPGPPVLRPIAGEASRLSDFLHGIAAPAEAYPGGNTGLPPVAIAPNVAARTAPANGWEATIAFYAPQADTDPRTEQSQPRSLASALSLQPAVLPNVARPKSDQPWWQNAWIMIPGGIGGAAVVCLLAFLVLYVMQIQETAARTRQTPTPAPDQSGGGETGGAPSAAAPAPGISVSPQAASATDRVGGAPSPSSVALQPVQESATAPSVAIAPFNAATARSYQEAWAKDLGTTVETTNTLGAKMILIPPGEFLMGSTDEQVASAIELAKVVTGDPIVQERIEKVERPQHSVVITRPFLMGATEVTIGQFRQFTQDSQCVTEAELYGFGNGSGSVIDSKTTDRQKQMNWRTPGYDVTDDSPVAQVSWNDAMAFCQWLSTHEKTTYRLPTEAEWEYACRAGTTTQYSFGDDPNELEQFAWYGKNSELKSHPVGAKQPNHFGLHDMHGNLWEWCQDFGELKAYENSAQVDPRGLTYGTLLIVRGGHCYLDASQCRSAHRHWAVPSGRGGNCGFRVVREWHPSPAGTAPPNPAAP